jgi:hypothetical protein
MNPPNASCPRRYSFAAALLFMLLVVSFVAFSTALVAQTQSLPALPSQWRFSDDGKMLLTGSKAATGLYERGTIRKVYLTFTQPNYWALLTANYATEGNIHANLEVDGTKYNGVGVRFRGNTSYTGTGTSQKKSFAVETDFVNGDQTLMGYKNLKFNNAHQDATFMREVLYNRLGSRYAPMAKANYVRLYINNEDWGIYANVQSIDKTFLKEWFLSNNGARFRATVESTGGAGGVTMGLPGGMTMGMPGGGAGGGAGGGWGDGTAGMNYLGNDSAVYKRYYDLKSSDVANSWQKLITACQTLSTATAATVSTLDKTIDIDKALWFLAVENIFTDDDSYVMKGKMDYYVYYEPESGRTMPLEYDGNSAFQTNAATSSAWGAFKNATNPNYPLLNKLLSIPALRQRYLAHYRAILQETFTAANVNAVIDELDRQIATEVASDTKKLYPTAQYTSGVPALKTFVTNRRAFLLADAEVAQAVQAAPIIASAAYFNSAGRESTAPQAQESVTVRANISAAGAASGISKATLYYASGLVGGFVATTMFDDGAHSDGAANDGVFGGTIPGFAGGTLVRYYVEALANNAAKTASYLPLGAEHDVFVYTVSAASAPEKTVVVNELVASNTTGAKDEAGDYEDWIELYNTTASPVNLSGYYLSDAPATPLKWRFPAGTTIPANGYTIVWADEEANEGPLHANFKLSASGESVILSDSSGRMLDQITFPALAANASYARVPNGTGGFVVQTPSPRANNNLMATSVSTSFGAGSGASSAVLRVFPQPASSMMVIEFENRDQFLSTALGKQLELYNAFGQKVMEARADAQRMTFDIAALPQGVYYLRCGEYRRVLLKN